MMNQAIFCAHLSLMAATMSGGLARLRYLMQAEQASWR
jgi:hypothetical protein